MALRTRDFFENVTGDVGRLDVQVIVVTHLLPDRPTFLSALSGVADLAVVIPKPRSIHEPTLAAVEADYQIARCTRPELAGANCVELVRGWVDTQRPFAVLDIGGYFARGALELHNAFGNCFLGVVEDTENGYRRYEKAIPQPTFPVFSVARSRLKYAEDYLVGHSVVFSAEAVLRQHNQVLGGKHALVLGFGKIGRSIAESLAAHKAIVSVFDTDPIQRIQALAHGYSIPERIKALERAQLLFCATGHKSIAVYDFENLPGESFIFSVTSSDDEMYLNDTFPGFDEKPLEPSGVTLSSRATGRRVHLVHHGNAVNFLHQATVGDFIYLVQGELILALAQLVGWNGPPGYHQVSEEKRERLAEAWIKSSSPNVRLQPNV